MRCLKVVQLRRQEACRLQLIEVSYLFLRNERRHKSIVDSRILKRYFDMGHAGLSHTWSTKSE